MYLMLTSERIGMGYAIGSRPERCREILDKYSQHSVSPRDWGEFHPEVPLRLVRRALDAYPLTVDWVKRNVIFFN